MYLTLESLIGLLHELVSFCWVCLSSLHLQIIIKLSKIISPNRKNIDFPIDSDSFCQFEKKKNADTKQNVAENYDKNIVRGDV